MDKKILVIDDDPRILQTFARYLQRSGYEVLMAEDGTEGVRRYAEELPILVFTDVLMPPPNGFAVLRAIHELNRDAEVVLITGHGDMGMAIEAVRVGAADFIQKPVTPELLATALGRAEERLRLKGELRAAQASLTQYTADLESRVAARTQELVAANVQLQFLDRLKAKFITDISHELRTPLAHIYLLLELLETKPEKHAEYQAALKTQVAQLTHTIEDIMAFAELDLHKTELTMASFDLNALVQKVTEPYQACGTAAKLCLCFEPDAALPLVLGNPAQIARLVGELVDNAVNYTIAGTIVVRTRHEVEQQRICLEVADTGRGIDSEDLPHLFERFYRGKRIGSSNIPGTGLGLAIVKEVLAIHDWTIEVESQVGMGSTFRVYIPLGES